MNTIILRSTLLIATASCLSFSATAASKEGSSTRAHSPLEHAVKQQIDRHLFYPLSDQDGKMYGAVDVNFVVNLEGRLEVLSAASANEALRAYVLEKLAHVNVGANPSGIWQTTHVRFVFQPESEGLGL